jgi:hypothetical protein
MKQLLIAFLLVISTVMVGQERQFLEGEMELGGGLFSFGISDGFELVAIGGAQAQFDYDFIEGPFRAAIGIKAMALGGYTFFQPGVKIGKDIINMNISVASDGLTYYGLSSRIDLSANKQHAVNLSLQGASDIDGYGYALLFVGYSHRFK